MGNVADFVPTGNAITGSSDPTAGNVDLGLREFLQFHQTMLGYYLDQDLCAAFSISILVEKYPSNLWQVSAVATTSAYNFKKIKKITYLCFKYSTVIKNNSWIKDRYSTRLFLKLHSAVYDWFNY